jgi:DNA helicase-2/ATP-dependent DNA helicase PcrA
LTTASMTLKSAFVSAGSHLQALTEKSINCAVAIPESFENSQDQPKTKGASKKPTKDLEGQGTLFSFLGKAEPVTRKRPAPTTDSEQRKSIKTNSQALGMGRNLNTPRPTTSTNELIAIAPTLANHRLGPRQNGIRRKHPVHSEQHSRNDYAFLSSPPPRPKPFIPDIEEPPEKPPGLTAKPALLPLIRPATSMHTTTVSIAQNSHGSKKTLGVKRSMNGWSSGTGQAFRPPTMKRTT